VRNTTLLWTRWIRSEYLQRKPSPDFSGEGLVDFSFQLLFTAFARATFCVALAAISRWRRRCRRADACHQSSNQKKIFHMILRFEFC
jgi:hypothetical protein